MGTRVYVGNLPGDIRRGEVDSIFGKYGRIRALDIKGGRDPSAPAFAFIEFEHPRDTYDAIRGEDGMSIGGMRMRVEESKGGKVNPSSRGPPTRSGFRVRVSGLPANASWQDLKDHMRTAGDVGFADVYRNDGGAYGVVEYKNQGDMETALAKLHNSEFTNKFGDKAMVTVEEEKGDAPPPSAPSNRGPGGGGRGGDGRGPGGGGYGGGRDDRGYGGGRDDRGRGEERREERPRERSRSREPREERVERGEDARAPREDAY